MQSVREEGHVQKEPRGTAWGARGRGVTFRCRGCRFDPWLGTKTPSASWPRNQNTEQKRYCEKLNKRLKVVHVKNNSDKIPKN